MSDAMLDRLAGVLALAEGGATAEERENATRFAQFIAAKYRIDLAAAEARLHRRGERPAPEIEHIVLGKRGDRGAGGYAELFLAISNVNDVRLILADSGAWVDAYGFSDDLATTKALYAVLVVQMIEECVSYLDSGAYRSDGVTRNSARRSFHTGFVQRVSRRLNEARADAEQQARIELGARAGEAELVLVDRRSEVHSVFSNAASGKKFWTRDSGSGAHSRAAGDLAGRRARLRAEKEVGGDRPAVRAG